MAKGYNPYRNPLNGQFTTASGAVGKALDLVSGPGSSRSARGRGPSSNASRRLAASADSRTSTGKTVRRGSVRSAQRDTSMPAASWSDDPGGTRRVGNRVERVTQARSQTDGLSRRDGSRVSRVRDLTDGGPRRPRNSKSDSRPASDKQPWTPQSLLDEWDPPKPSDPAREAHLAGMQQQNMRAKAAEARDAADERRRREQNRRAATPTPAEREEGRKWEAAARAATNKQREDYEKAEAARRNDPARQANLAGMQQQNMRAKAAEARDAARERTAFPQQVPSMSDQELADYRKSMRGKNDVISTVNKNAVNAEIKRRKSARSGSKPWTERSAAELAAEDAAIVAERKARAERRAAARAADLPAAKPVRSPEYEAKVAASRKVPRPAGTVWNGSAWVKPNEMSIPIVKAEDLPVTGRTARDIAAQMEKANPTVARGVAGRKVVRAQQSALRRVPRGGESFK